MAFGSRGFKVLLRNRLEQHHIQQNTTSARGIFTTLHYSRGRQQSIPFASQRGFITSNWNSTPWTRDLKSSTGVFQQLQQKQQKKLYSSDSDRISRMSSQAGQGGEFKSNVPGQAQNLPGTEKAMQPTSESTKLEGKDGFREYKGVRKLKGKKVIITGGDSGIGRSVAVLMAREGADITIVYLPEEQEDAEETKRMVEREKQQCLCLPFDLMDNKNCKEVVDKHIAKFGHIDVLVNNASKQIQCEKFEEIDLDNVESTFKSNILQMFALTKFSIPHMPKGSSIINTTSVTAFRGSKTLVDYSSTKGAIVSFTRALSKNVLPKGIRVNAVAPGPVHTPLQPASRTDQEMEGFGSQSKFGRPGQPSEIAPSFILLASAEGELYTGQILHPYALGD